MKSMKSLIFLVALAGCGDDINRPSVEEGVIDITYAWCEGHADCGDSFDVDACAEDNRSNICLSYLDCDVEQTEEQAELIASCTADIGELQCSTATPDSCLELFGVE